MAALIRSRSNHRQLQSHRMSDALSASDGMKDGHRGGGGMKPQTGSYHIYMYMYPGADGILSNPRMLSI